MPRTDVTEERTRQIIEAAIAVFARLGIGGARMEDIAQEAGLSKGTLYLYFESKDALIGAILDSTLARELAYAREQLTQDRPVVEKLNLLTEVLLEEVRGMKHLSSLYLEFLALASREDKVRQVVQGPFRDFTEVFKALIEQGIASGEFRPVDPHVVAQAIAAIVEGTFMIWVYDPEEVRLETQIKASMNLLVAGLVNGPES